MQSMSTHYNLLHFCKTCNIFTHHQSDVPLKSWHMETTRLKTAGGQTREHSKHIPQDQNESVVFSCGRQHTEANWETTLPKWYKLSGLGPR